jgi:hypothetical protein
MCSAPITEKLSAWKETASLKIITETLQTKVRFCVVEAVICLYFPEYPIAIQNYGTGMFKKFHSGKNR